MIPPRTPISLSPHGKRKYTTPPFDNRNEPRRLLSPFREQTHSQNLDPEHESIWSAAVASLKDHLHFIQNWQPPQLPTADVSHPGAYIGIFLPRLLLLIIIIILLVYALYKLLQHALVYPLAEILFHLSPYLGYLIAAALLLATGLAFSTLTRHCAHTIRTALHLVIILYLLPSLLGVDGATLPALLKAALRWTWDMNALGAETARRLYFSLWAPPSPFHVRP